MNKEEIAFKDRKNLVQLNENDLLDIIEFLQNDRKQWINQFSKTHNESIDIQKENQELKQKYENAVADYETTMAEKEQLKKQLEERDKWLIVCISELMEEFKKDTFWITNEQIESTKNKNISYEVYGNNDIKFYQNIKK